MRKQDFLIALGSNLGAPPLDPAQVLAASIKEMSQHGLQPRRVSRFFSTPCFPAGAGPDYVNAVVLIRAGLSPQTVLAALHRIEAAFDRQRISRWAARTLDLDLLAAGDAVLPDRQTFDTWLTLPPDRQRAEAPDRLILPHPRIQDRAFVLVPLCDIAPDWQHPVLGQSARALCKRLPQALRDAVKPL